MINKPDLFEATKYKAFRVESDAKTSYLAVNTNKTLDNIPYLIASKTGLTDLSGGNLVFAFDADLNHPIVVAILGSSESGRFDDALKLINMSKSFISQTVQ